MNDTLGQRVGKRLLEGVVVITLAGIFVLWAFSGSQDIAHNTTMIRLLGLTVIGIGLYNYYNHPAPEASPGQSGIDNGIFGTIITFIALFVGVGLIAETYGIPMLDLGSFAGYAILDLMGVPNSGM